MRIVIATDAWRPQVNGVVHTLECMSAAARDQGADISFITPEGFPTAPLPTYADIRLALASTREIGRRIEATGADHVHIATEGPVGFAARRYCLSQRRPFTTSYHTRFPEYIAARIRIPTAWTYAVLRRFHGPGLATLVPTPSMGEELRRRGFIGVHVWTRGVDHSLFRLRIGGPSSLPRPIFLYVGRIAVEKNLEAFLDLSLPGSKVIVGDGPARANLQRRYPQTHFLGSLYGDALAQTYAGADVFVFPSVTDTFGIVLIEALASGLPVAAFPVTGPLDIIGQSGAGALSFDLRSACLAALEVPREKAREQSLRYTWAESARQFLGHIRNARSPPLTH